MKNFRISFLIINFVFAFFIGCKDSAVNKDTVAPSNVTDLKAESVAGKIIITWKDPVDVDFYGVKISTGTDVNGTVTFEKNILVTNGVQKYNATGLENGKSYIFKLTSIDESLNESSGVTTESVVFTENVVQKVGLKYVCPTCKKEYDTAKEASECCGTKVSYFTEFTGGTYNVHHFTQDLDPLENYNLYDVEKNKVVSEKSQIDSVQKNIPGFSVASYAYNGESIYIYYNRKIITYKFIPGSNGEFSDGSESIEKSGLYGSKIPRLLKPRSKTNELNFKGWKNSVDGKILSDTFGPESATVEPDWLDIVQWVESKKDSSKTSIFSGNELVLLSGDVVTTSIKTGSIAPFLIGKYEVDILKWNDVKEWAESNGYSFSWGIVGKSGVCARIDDKFDLIKYCIYDTAEVDRIQECQNFKTDDLKTTYFDLKTGDRYFIQDSKKSYFAAYLYCEVKKSPDGKTGIVQTSGEREVEHISNYEEYQEEDSETLYLIKKGLVTADLSDTKTVNHKVKLISKTDGTVKYLNECSMEMQIFKNSNGVWEIINRYIYPKLMTDYVFMMI